MEKIRKYWSVKKAVALLLIVTITSVYVIGDKFSSVTITKDNNTCVSVSNQNANDIKPISELNLAKTDTEIGKAVESMKNGYEELAACKNKNDFDTAMKSFAQLVSSLKNEMIEELDATDNGTEEYINYRLSVMSGFEELENCISGQNQKNYEAVVEEIGEIVDSEKQNMPLAEELPFNNISVDEIATEAHDENSTIAYDIGNENYSEGDLEFTNDVVINDKIRSEFSELSGVLEVYQYIKNNYMPEFYYGSRKGSVGAFEEKAGNDYDLSSLLLAVLRDREIPAHYVRGEIEITAEQAVKWTAADNINAALRMLSSLGIPVTGLTKDGDIVAVRLEHVWVEAYVPYTDYRGAGNQSGESLWIPLDVSFKELNHLEGIELTSLNDYINNAENFLDADTEMNGVNIGEISTVISGQDSALTKYLLENGYADSTRDEVFGGREIVYEDLGYLPLTLPYTVLEKIDSFSDIPFELTDSVLFSLVGNSAYELEFNDSKSIDKVLYTPDLYGKRVVLAYTPASESDEEILEQYGGIFKTPAYLLKLRPQLIVDGEVVAEGSVCNAGYRQKYTINIHNGSQHKNDSKVENTVAAGGIYCIALDYGTISAGELENLSDNMEALKEIVSEDNIYTDAAMGEMLNSIAKAYFAQLDMYNAIISGQYNVTSTRDLSVGIVGFNVNVVYTFNRPAELNEGGVFLDIGHDAHSVVSNDNNNTNEKTYMLQSGIYASAMEHGILEQVTGVESVSTIKTFQYAVENNISFHAIAKENISTELSQLNVSEQIKQDIYTAVNTGKIVIIPEHEIEINQWSGIGYMVLDPDTFACGYMISGGLAGGAMTAGQMLSEYIQYVVLGAVFIVLWEVLTTALLAMTPCGWLAAVQMILKAAQIIMLINAVVQMVDLVVMYAETGDIYYLQELLVQVSACATLGIATKLLGNKLTQLKEKVTKAIDEAGLKGQCFIAGTLILTSVGLVPIEAVAAGDMVLSFNPDTQVVSEQVVEETFVRESSELVHIEVGNETISATPDHPFYVPQKGFVEAVNLRAGDILCTVNGEYVIVEQIQHEILEKPIEVYNFRVANTHTYFVGDVSVGVHNANYANPGNNVKPESAVTGSKKHGVNWKEGPARAKATGKPQGQWAKEDLDFATKMANLLKPGESGYFDLPEGAKSIVHMPDGTTKPATRFWIRNNGTGTWHGYPME